LSPFFRRAAVVVPLIVPFLALAACASGPKPEQIIASVTPGMSQTELVQKIGPPDNEYSAGGRTCFQYAIGDKNVPLAVYFDDQHRVAGTARGACQGRVR
jgi:hypothetical protein